MCRCRRCLRFSSRRARSSSSLFLLRTMTDPMKATARTLMTGVPGMTGTSASLESSTEPMNGRPDTWTSIPSGTMISIPPMKAMAAMWTSGPWNSASRRSISAPPMKAMAVVFSLVRHRPLVLPWLMIPMTHRRALRRAIGRACDTGTAGIGSPRSTRSSSPHVCAAKTSSSRSENSSRVRRPSVQCSRKIPMTVFRSASDALTDDRSGSRGVRDVTESDRLRQAACR